MNQFIIVLKRILHYKYFYKLLCFCVLLLVIIFTNTYKKTSIYSTNIISLKGVITNIDISNNKLSLTVNCKEKVIANYYYEDINKYSYLELGDTILIKGEFTVPKSNTIPNLFNYKKYLYNKNIFYIINIDSIDLISKNESVFYFFKNKIIKRINSIKGVNNYLNTFILGNNTIDNEINNTYKSNGISHLFSISGMHITLFSTFLFFILKKISYSKRYNYLIVILFLIFYMHLIGNTDSVVRTVLMFIIFSLNDLFKLKISRIDLMLITLIIILIINPYIIYSISFQYSYLITFTIILKSKSIKNKKNYFTKSIYISYISFLVSFPITIYNFYQVNFLSILFNLIFIPFVSIIIFPLAILTFIFPFLSNILLIFINILEYISCLFSNIKILEIVFAKPSIYIIFIYYIIIYLSLYNKKYLIIFIIGLFIHKNIVYFNNNMNIIFLDVGQGDSTLITLPNNKGNILIDTGGLYNDYSLTDNKLIPYFKSLGINTINYLIVTHGDSDHMKESITLINKIKIDNIIFNKGNYNDLELELINKIKEKDINYYKCNDLLEVNGYKFYFLNNKIYDNENDNSNIIYFSYYNTSLLLMADASIKNEEYLLNNYKLNNIDILKVGHHGSITSSSKKFVNYINNDISVISVGVNNIYKHPNKEVLNNLSNSIILRTDINGSIVFKLNKKTYTFYNVAA